MRQQISNGRIERKYNQNQLFMYYRSPKLIEYAEGRIPGNVRANSGRILHLNPERYTTQVEVQERWSPLRGHYKVCSSLDNKSQRIERLPKMPLRSSLNIIDQEQQSQGLDKESILAERARQFINRIRKQRQYDHGRALLRKKKEEELRKNREKEEAKMRANYKKFVKEHRQNMLTDSILFHQERICERLRNSISRYHLSSLRSKTEQIPQIPHEKPNELQTAQFQLIDPAESKIEYSPVIDLRKKYKN